MRLRGLHDGSVLGEQCIAYVRYGTSTRGPVPSTRHTEYRRHLQVLHERHGHNVHRGSGASLGRRALEPSYEDRPASNDHRRM